MNITPHSNTVPSMTEKQLAIAVEAEEYVSSLPQIDITTWHLLHGGIYSRTIVLEPGQIIVGAVIIVPTTIVIHGNLTLYTGGDVIDIEGTQVLAASVGRKQVMHATERTSLTMSFVTDATTVEEAENEFTTEPEKLMSRLEESINFVNITGE